MVKSYFIRIISFFSNLASNPRVASLSRGKRRAARARKLNSVDISGFYFKLVLNSHTSFKQVVTVKRLVISGLFLPKLGLTWRILG